MVGEPFNDSRSDTELIAGINAGDPAAFDVLYLRHRDFVAGLARRLTGNDADALDVLQETFAYLLRKFPGFRLTAAMTTFLYPVVKHLSEAALRKRRRHTTEADSTTLNLPARSSAPSSRQQEDLAAALATLPDAQREVVLMRFVDDMQLNEIAEALGVPEGTIKSRLHNALAALRKDPRTRERFETR
jgi:RNA polymerase sigma-70 factor (ECF subfamily)